MSYGYEVIKRKKSSGKIRTFLCGAIIGATLAASIVGASKPEASECPDKYELMLEGLTTVISGGTVGYIPPMKPKGVN